VIAPSKFLALLFFAFAGASGLFAAGKSQPEYSAWIDFREVAGKGMSRDALPTWIEGIEWLFTESKEQPRVIARIRFRDVRILNLQLLARVFFRDDPAACPRVSGWTETGEKVFSSNELGDGIGLSTFENVVASTTGVDYIEIEALGNGANLRGVFLTLLKTREVFGGIEFDKPAPVHDPFAAALPRRVAPADDEYLYGRVRATLDATPLKIARKDGGKGVFQFELESKPLIAILSCEILNVALDAPPTFELNGQVLGAGSFALPDLADPAYVGSVRPLQDGMNFRYAGWMKTQVIVPGSMLERGANELVCILGARANSIAVRNVELQLKYLSPKLEYKLRP
jgi:hypothetical protein